MSDPGRGSLTLGDGETVVLLGPSGSGKTSWLRCLLGLDSPFARNEMLGKPASRGVVAAALGWVPQGDGVFLSETVWTNVVAPRFVEPCSRDAALDALDLVGLADRAEEPVTHMGLGSRRRVALARALARKKPILIVDGGLDPSLWQLFPALRSHLPWLRGVLATSCVADDLVWSASSVGLIAEGAIVFQGPMSEVASSRDPALRNVSTWVMP